MATDTSNSLPAVVTEQSPSLSAGSKLDALRNLPARLDDQTLARVEALANSPLRPLPSIEAGALEEWLMLLMTLPHQASGRVDGVLKVEAYSLALRRLPQPQIEFMVEEAIRTCRWLPSPAECLAIADKWRRHDAAVESRHLAKSISRREREARLDGARAALKAGTMDQAAIDALPERWRRIFETESLLRLHPDGSFTLRPRPQPDAGSITNVADIADRMAERFPSHRDLGEAA